MAARVYASYPPEPFAPIGTSEPQAPMAAAEELEDSIPLNVAPDIDPVVTAEASEPPLVLILTPPPEVASEPPATADVPSEPEPDASEEPVADETPTLFASDAPPAPEDGLVLAEAPPEPEGRTQRWSETAAYFGMGAVGLVAFGAGIAGFQLADASEVPGGFNEKTVIGWVLVLIGVICVWIASYNLFKRLGGSED